jgi:hypothetical protein
MYFAVPRLSRFVILQLDTLQHPFLNRVCYKKGNVHQNRQRTMHSRDFAFNFHFRPTP